MIKQIFEQKNMRNLDYLDFSENRLSDNFLMEIKNSELLKNIKSLILKDTKISYLGLEELGNIPNIEHLNLSNNIEIRDEGIIYLENII